MSLRALRPLFPALLAPSLLAIGLLTIGLLAGPAVAQAERRVALVIGNSAYKAAPLKNPVNDARDIAASLKALGFEVTLLPDATHKQMEAAVREFGLSLRQGGVGLFYYAGHGIQVGGENYLVPVDAVIQTESDVKFGSLNAGLVLGKMEDAGNALNIVILDACRNNPFARSFRSAEAGLAKMDAPTGSIIAYATAPGSVASDGVGKNGVYTRHLLETMRTPGLSITDVFMRVRMGVVADTAKKQVPWESSSLTGYFYLTGGPQGGAPVAAAPAPAPAPAPVVAQPTPAPAPTALDIKAEKKRLAEEAQRLKRDRQELAEVQSLQAEKGRLEAERQKLEQAKVYALGGRPKQVPAAAPAAVPQAASHAAQLAQLARLGLPDARAYFERAVQARADDNDARAGLAIAQVFAGRGEDARYQLQRLDESFGQGAGAQSAAVRVAKGLLLGLTGSQDSQYQMNRALEEGADRALVSLCLATAAERAGDLERGLKLMADYAALVPEAERGEYAKRLADKLDLPGRIAGVYDWMVKDAASEKGVFTFARSGGQLSGIYVQRGSSDQIPLENVRLEGRRLTFTFRRQVFISTWVYTFTCDVSGNLDTLPVLKLDFKGKKSNFSDGRLVRRGASSTEAH